MATLTDLLPSFALALRAANRSPRTEESYRLAVQQLEAFQIANGRPAEVAQVTRTDLRGFLAHLLDTRAPATAAQRYASLNVYFRWCVDEGELDGNPLDGVRKPAVPSKPMRIPTDAEVRAVLATADGRSFVDRRDTAILRLLAATGARLSEVANLHLGQVDLERQQLLTTVKGGALVTKPFDAKTAQAVDRWLRVRRTHRYAELPWLWIGPRGRLGPSGVQQMLKRRCAAAGVEPFGPHALRHRFAHRWLSGGGSEGDLLRLMSWSSREMLDRYGISAAGERAEDAYHRLGIGGDL